MTNKTMATKKKDAGVPAMVNEFSLGDAKEWRSMTEIIGNGIAKNEPRTHKFGPYNLAVQPETRTDSGLCKIQLAEVGVNQKSEIWHDPVNASVEELWLKLGALVLYHEMQKAQPEATRALELMKKGEYNKLNDIADTDEFKIEDEKTELAAV